MRRPRRQNQSSGNRGKCWEKALGAQHELYRMRGLADIEHIPTPMRALDSPRPSEANGRPVFTACYEKGRHVDFMGVLDDGRAVRLEAKQCSSANRIELDRVDGHQARSLDRCERLGGLSAVLVLLPSGLWVVPWMHWTPAVVNGRKKKSLSPADLDDRGERFNDQVAAQSIIAGGGGGADWLAATKRRRWA